MKFAGVTKFAAPFASALAAVAALAGCSGIPRHESSAQLLARYTAYAGAPVSELKTYSPSDSWSAIDDHHVLIQTGASDAYLLTVAPPCINLPFANRLALTSRFPHTVSSGFDSIRVGRESCRITEIRPVNYRQLREQLRADAAEDKKRG